MSKASRKKQEGSIAEEVGRALIAWEDWTRAVLAEARGDGPPVAGLSPTSSSAKPGMGQIILPSGNTTNLLSAQSAFLALRGCEHGFYRGPADDVVVYDSAREELEKVTAQQLRSSVDLTGPIWRWLALAKGDMELIRGGRTSFDVAKMWMESSARKILEPVQRVNPLPVLVQNGVKSSRLLTAGYHRPQQLIVSRGQSLPSTSLEQAKAIILDDLFGEFQFQTEPDRSRAVAALLLPAMQQGELLPSARTPFVVTEASDPKSKSGSQTGKGLLLRLIRRSYGDNRTATTPRTYGGVGSFDERLQSALAKGKMFLFLDNLRGKLDSEILEQAMTENLIMLRLPGGATPVVDTSKVCWQLTTNGLLVTPDMANRFCMIRLVRRHGVEWRNFEEGQVDDHVAAQPMKFLGAVHAVLGEWISRGSPLSRDLRGPGAFRRWWQAVDYICREILGLPSPLDGHGEIAMRSSSPQATWFRNVLQVLASDRGSSSKEWTAEGFAEVSNEHAVSPTPWEKGKAEGRGVGRALATVFDSGDEFRWEGGSVERELCFVPRKDGKGTFEQKVYRLRFV